MHVAATTDPWRCSSPPSPARSSSTCSSDSSSGPSRTSPRLSPALAVKAHSKQRKPSPLKRQMSVGHNVANGASSPALAIQQQAREDIVKIDPNRSHTAGPFAVLFSVDPQNDPLLASPGQSRHSSIHSSPFETTSVTAVTANLQASPRRSSLAGLEAHQQASTSALPASPNRSLLSAFQAVSPRAPSPLPRPLSAPISIPSDTSSRTPFASPRPGATPSTSFLAPASPISGSPRLQPYNSNRTSFASAAFRALNGASPKRPSTASRASSSGSDSPRTFSSNSLQPSNNPAQCDQPTWQIYRDPIVARPARRAPTATSEVFISNEAASAEDQAIETEQSMDEPEELQDQENMAPAQVPVGLAELRTISAPSVATIRRNSLSLTAHGSLQPTSGLPRSHSGPLPSTLTSRRERQVTPPPDACKLFQAVTTDDTTCVNELAGPSTQPPSTSDSVKRASKRLRTSG